MDRPMSVVTLSAFVITAIGNGMVSSGVTVPLTNPEISFGHPVYIVPSGWAFSIWGVIYLLVGIFACMQALPSQLADPKLREARPYACVSFLTNLTWLYCFSFELYWVSFVIIVFYCLSLLKLIEIFDVDYCSAERTWQHKLYASAFSANGAWVCVATALQVCLNTMDEGWLVSPDFTTGLIFAVSLLACYNVYRHGDLIYAFISAWALGGIISNQGEGSKWGMLNSICSEACKSTMRICQEGGLWGTVCSVDIDPEKDVQVVPKSNKVINFCWTCIGFVLVALVAGIVRGLLLRKNGASDPARLSMTAKKEDPAEDVALESAGDEVA